MEKLLKGRLFSELQLNELILQFIFAYFKLLTVLILRVCPIMSASTPPFGPKLTLLSILFYKSNICFHCSGSNVLIKKITMKKKQFEFLIYWADCSFDEHEGHLVLQRCSRPSCPCAGGSSPPLCRGWSWTPHLAAVIPCRSMGKRDNNINWSHRCPRQGPN